MSSKKFDTNFKLMIISKIISIVGGNVLGFAMILFLVDFTQSAAMLGIIQSVSQVPLLFINPFAGMIADRFDKKKLIVLFDVLKALSNVYLLWLLMTSSYNIANLTFLRMLKMAIISFSGIVFNTSIPSVVNKEQLVAANGIMQSIMAVGLIGGSVIGGVLFGVLDLETIAIASSVTFLISAVISMFIKIPYVPRSIDSGIFAIFKSDIGESVQFMKNENPIILKLALVTAVITLIFPPIFNTGLPFIVGVVFDQQVTLSFGIAAIGMLVGGIAAGKLTRLLAIKNLAKWIGAIGIVTISLSVAFMPIIHSVVIAFWFFNIALAVLLFIFALLNSSFGAFMQQVVPSEILGKVNSLIGLISLIAGPFGILAVGFLIETVHLPFFFGGLSVLTMVLAFICQWILNGYSKEKRK